MKKPKIPENEERRVEALYSLKILDTAAEERFDRITRLASRFFDVPIAYVALVDEHRQWFKSKQGLDINETSRDHSFCGHTILGHEPLVIEDVQKDERFNDNPMVTKSPNIRFYAGYPLSLGDDLNLGTLCVVDKNPRVFTKKDVQVLKDFAEMVETEMKAKCDASTDDLTGLCNRRGLYELGEYFYKIAVRDNLPISFFYIDLDQFKKINDSFGHDEGDRALKETSHILLKSFRALDVLARFGGDEFCAMCSNLTNEQAEYVKQTILSSLEERNKRSDIKYDLKASIGIVTKEANSFNSFDEIIKAADKEMYKEKRS